MTEQMHIFFIFFTITVGLSLCWVRIKSTRRVTCLQSLEGRAIKSKGGTKNGWERRNEGGEMGEKEGRRGMGKTDRPCGAKFSIVRGLSCLWATLIVLISREGNSLTAD